MPTFSRGDWVSKHAPQFMESLDVFVGAPVCALELGTFEGRSACWFLDNVLTHPDSRLVCVDPYAYDKDYKGQHGLASVSGIETMLDQACETAIANLERYDNVDFHYGKSSEEFLRSRQTQGLTFDFIYIDGNHHSGYVLLDAVLSWNLLKIGGVMMFDDYRWGGKRKGYQTPRVAINSFLRCYQDWLKVIHKNRQVHIRKLC